MRYAWGCAQSSLKKPFLSQLKRTFSSCSANVTPNFTFAFALTCKTSVFCVKSQCKCCLLQWYPRKQRLMSRLCVLRHKVPKVSKILSFDVWKPSIWTSFPEQMEHLRPSILVHERSQVDGRVLLQNKLNHSVSLFSSSFCSCSLGTFSRSS